jgi:CrcB protein
MRTREVRPVALVAVGGAAGSTARYAVGAVLPSLVSTLAANVIGCFALGYLLYAHRLGGVSERTRLIAATGFLSSFTTYSTFAHDIFVSRPDVAVLYVAASYVLGFGAVAAGSTLAVRGGEP